MKENAPHLITSIFRKAWALAIFEPLVLILVLTLLTPPYVIMDYIVPEEGIPAAWLIISLFVLALQIAVMHRTFVKQDWIEFRHDVSAGFYSRAFGQNFISVIAIIAGLLLLVLPGLFLAVRWSLSMPILLARDCGIIDSLRQSWKMTSAYFWPIFGTLSLAYLPFIFAIVMIIIFPEPTSALWGLISVELVTSVSILFGWYVQIAFYQHIKNEIDLSS